jgi:hypothetical protein
MDDDDDHSVFSTGSFDHAVLTLHLPTPTAGLGSLPDHAVLDVTDFQFTAPTVTTPDYISSSFLGPTLFMLHHDEPDVPTPAPFATHIIPASASWAPNAAFDAFYRPLYLATSELWNGSVYQRHEFDFGTPRSLIPPSAAFTVYYFSPFLPSGSRLMVQTASAYYTTLTYTYQREQYVLTQAHPAGNPNFHYQQLVDLHLLQTFQKLIVLLLYLLIVLTRPVVPPGPVLTAIHDSNLLPIPMLGSRPFVTQQPFIHVSGARFTIEEYDMNGFNSHPQFHITSTDPEFIRICSLYYLS